MGEKNYQKKKKLVVNLQKILIAKGRHFQAELLKLYLGTYLPKSQHPMSLWPAIWAAASAQPAGDQGSPGAAGSRRPQPLPDVKGHCPSKPLAKPTYQQALHKSFTPKPREISVQHISYRHTTDATVEKLEVQSGGVQTCADFFYCNHW